jgi:hypothetical protein
MTNSRTLHWAKIYQGVFRRTLLIALLLSVAPGLRPDSNTQLVSLVRIIANPQQYSGKPVSVIGYLVVATGGTAIYLSSNDYEHQITANALWVKMNSQMQHNEEKLSMNYVLLEGVFDSGHLGLMPYPSGAIVEVTRCDVWSDTRSPRAEKWGGKRPD